MRISGQIKLGLFLFISLASQLAHSGDLYLTGEAGWSNFYVSEKFRPAQSSKGSFSNFAYGISLSYTFDSSFIVAAKDTHYSAINLIGESDRAHVDETCAGAGYSFKYGEKYHIIPMLYYCNWNLEYNESSLYNISTQTTRYEGNDFILKLDFEMPWSNQDTYILSYTYGKYDFGSLHALMFGWKFHMIDF